MERIRDADPVCHVCCVLTLLMVHAYLCMLCGTAFLRLGRRMGAFRRLAHRSHIAILMPCPLSALTVTAARRFPWHQFRIMQDSCQWLAWFGVLGKCVRVQNRGRIRPSIPV